MKPMQNFPFLVSYIIMEKYIQAKIKTLRIIWYFFKPFKIRVSILLIAMIASGLLEALNMAALYPVVNYGLKLENDNFVLRLLSGAISYFGTDNYFMFSCIMLFVVTVIAVIAKYSYSFLANRLTADIIKNIQKSIFQKYITADYVFFTQSQQGNLIHTATIAPTFVTDMVIYVFRLAYDMLYFLFMFFLLLILTRQGTLLVISIAFIYGVLVKGVVEKTIYKCGVAATEEDRKKNVILNELILGIKPIRIFSNFDCWWEKYIGAVERSAHNRFKMLMGQVLPSSFAKLLLFGSVAVVGVIISFRPPENLISSIPLFGTFAIVASRFFPSIQAAGMDIMIIAERLPNAEIVRSLCTTKLKMLTDGTKILNKFNEKIVFEDVWFKYEGMQECLLKGVTFTIEKKKITAIVGLSGAGKTTLVNLLLKLYQPTTGEVKIDGVNIFDYTNKSYLSKIGYVSQETFILNDTIDANIRFGMEECDDEMVIEAAKLANANEFIINMENTYDTVVGDSGMKLSGGQRQRIAIARAILRKPEILVLDEATSSLDNIAEKNVQKAINQISRNTTVVVIAHRLSTIRNAEKIVVLEDGSVLEEGTHKELMENNGLYFNLYTKRDILSEVSEENII